MAGKYRNLGKTLQLRHLSKDCHNLLSKSGQLVIGSDDDPVYGVAVDYSVRTGRFGGAH
jgi:SulP family sulfate permease